MTGIFESPYVPRLPTLLQEVRTGGILTPDFQRPLEWDNQRRLMLLDSVAKQIPIGSFLVWRTRDHNLKTLDTLGAYNLPKGPSEHVPRTYLLDGHQRLATLFAALTWTEHPELLHDQGVRWPTYYDLESDPTEMPFRFYLRSGTPPVTWLSLPSLFEPKRLFEHQKRLLQQGWEKEADLAEVLAERFKDYQIPVVPLVSEDLELVTESFVRINNQGKPMKETNMIRALAYSDCNIERNLENLKDDLAPLGWKEVDDQILLNVLKVRWGLNVYSSGPRDLYENIRTEGCEATFDALKTTVRWAVERLRGFGVHGPRSLPYAYQLVAFADVARRLAGKEVDPEQIDALRQWFWATTYGEYFTGMPASRIRDTIDYLWSVVDEGEDPLPSDLTREVDPLKDFYYQSTRSKALALLMVAHIADDELRAETELRVGEMGNAAIDKLYPDQPSSRPENRVVAVPRELSRLRSPMSPTFRLGNVALNDRPESDRRTLNERYIIPEGAPLAQMFTRNMPEQKEAVLKERREMLVALETKHILNIGLIISVRSPRDT